jgi:hypothetical protein
MIFNIVAIITSVVAFIASTYIALQHRALQKNANFIPAYMQILKEFRNVAFHDNYRYVTTQLQAEHDPKLGISGLPDEARRAVYDIGYFYQGFGMLRLMRVLDDQVLPTMQARIVRVWEAIEPYVERERELQGLSGLYFMRILEEFAKEAKELPSEAVNMALTRRGFVKIQDSLRRVGRQARP